jgi:hypothetical protein
LVVAPDRWHLNRSDEIDWHEWGDEFVVRVEHRAETHLLSAAAGAVLLALLDRREMMTVEGLYARAFRDLKLDRSNDLAMFTRELELVQAILSDFERLGIVKRAC